MMSAVLMGELKSAPTTGQIYLYVHIYIYICIDICRSKSTEITSNTVRPQRFAVYLVFVVAQFGVLAI